MGPTRFNKYVPIKISPGNESADVMITWLIYLRSPNLNGRLMHPKVSISLFDTELSLYLQLSIL